MTISPWASSKYLRRQVGHQSADGCPHALVLYDPPPLALAVDGHDRSNLQSSPHPATFQVGLLHL